MNLSYIRKALLVVLMFNVGMPAFGHPHHGSDCSSSCAVRHESSHDGGISKFTVGAGVAALIGVAATVKYLINYKKLREVDKKRDLEHLFFGDISYSTTKFYKWELKEWGTASAIESNWQKVLRRLVTLAKNKELSIADAHGFIIENPTWKDMRDAIERERKEFLTDMQQLESDHVVYADYAPSYFDAFGIARDYKNACYDAPLNNRGERAKPQSPGSWTQDQEYFINSYMDAAADKNIFFKMIKPNYHYAAQVYWQIYVLFQRVTQIERLLAEVEAGFAQATVRETVPEKIINYVLTARE